VDFDREGPKGRLLVGGERKEPISRLTIKDGQVTQAEILRFRSAKSWECGSLSSSPSMGAAKRAEESIIPARCRAHRTCRRR